MIGTIYEMNVKSKYLPFMHFFDSNLILSSNSNPQLTFVNRQLYCSLKAKNNSSGDIPKNNINLTIVNET